MKSSSVVPDFVSRASERLQESKATSNGINRHSPANERHVSNVRSVLLKGELQTGDQWFKQVPKKFRVFLLNFTSHNELLTLFI